MITVNIHEAKTQLSKLVDLAAKGEQGKRLGFLSGEISVPDDFNTMGEAEIAQFLGA